MSYSTLRNTKSLVLLLDIIASFSIAMMVSLAGALFGLSTSAAAFAMVYTTVLVAWRTL